MKRMESSDSLGALISMCPSAEEKNGGGGYSSRGFQSILDGFEEEEECGQASEKKRRLSVDQVKALEKNFEVENKLEPERKAKLAQELGLQPRQVAVWFQNRRARWKTKQLEKDYNLLKANYDNLKINFDNVKKDKETLMAELRGVKEKVGGRKSGGGGGSGGGDANKEAFPDPQDALAPIPTSKDTEDLKGHTMDGQDRSTGICPDLKDGSDSDSSAILNDENSPLHHPQSHHYHRPQTLLSSVSSSSAIIAEAAPPTSPPPPLPFLSLHHHHSNNYHIFSSSSSSSSSTNGGVTRFYPSPFARMEEHNFLNADESSCNFFADEQAPSLPWYCSDHWN
ncbi:homeobox-leucine zipper protein ATHB-6 [Amborella trichopoda]|uniref:Homeobox-leucine zipper protein n=1 Tax=Amborella trichopoda TaxID=13333 RepID=W1NIU7_AMBTC|nr:homeobox-leucine zipper protein ATHB-6 [Amborella trichopoda]ERM95386.1 hypothetical protein AMTR_s00008p00214750 [Amborella trichopoda]|eukprot:XP_006827970.1 homeobox-leucine zipper protein ATHB-6 [Amborella trichopoda]